MRFQIRHLYWILTDWPFIFSAGLEERRAGSIKIFILKWKTYLNIEQLEILKMRGGGERGGRWRHNYVHVGTGKDARYSVQLP
jgi:hypothetical protein